MKGFLVDENLPASLRLPGEFPTIHATAISPSPSDTQIWLYGRERQLVIVTKDADFSHRMLASDSPPWVVHVRLGNVRLQAFIQQVTQAWPTVLSLLPKHKLIIMLPDRIEAIE